MRAPRQQKRVDASPVVSPQKRSLESIQRDEQIERRGLSGAETKAAGAGVRYDGRHRQADALDRVFGVLPPDQGLTGHFRGSLDGHQDHVAPLEVELTGQRLVDYRTRGPRRPWHGTRCLSGPSLAVALEVKRPGVGKELRKAGADAEDLDVRGSPLSGI